MPMIIATLLFFFSAPAFSAGPEMDLSPGAVERGKNVFMLYCNSCHGLEYYRDKDSPQGIAPQVDRESALKSFGAVPPDLSLTAIAKGKRLDGAMYIYRLLTTYYIDEKGLEKNRAFAKETQSAGTIAMPQPIPDTDPELGQKAMDVSVFLLKVAEPYADDRKDIGRYVLIYMGALTIVLWALNRLTWSGLEK